MPHRVTNMLQNLMGVHDIETNGWRVDPGKVTGDKADIETGPRSGSCGLCHDGRVEVNAEHPARSDVSGEIDAQRSRPASDIKQMHRRLEVGQQVRGRVLSVAPAMRAKHSVGVTVRIRRPIRWDRSSVHWNKLANKPHSVEKSATHLCDELRAVRPSSPGSSGTGYGDTSRAH